MASKTSKTSDDKPKNDPSPAPKSAPKSAPTSLSQTSSPSKTTATKTTSAPKNRPESLSSTASSGGGSVTTRPPASRPASGVRDPTVSGTRFKAGMQVGGEPPIPSRKVQTFQVDSRGQPIIGVETTMSDVLNDPEGSGIRFSDILALRSALEPATVRAGLSSVPFETDLLDGPAEVAESGKIMLPPALYDFLQAPYLDRMNASSPAWDPRFNDIDWTASRGIDAAGGPPQDTKQSRRYPPQGPLNRGRPVLSDVALPSIEFNDPSTGEPRRVPGAYWVDPMVDPSREPSISHPAIRRGIDAAAAEGWLNARPTIDMPLTEQLERIPDTADAYIPDQSEAPQEETSVLQDIVTGIESLTDGSNPPRRMPVDFGDTPQSLTSTLGVLLDGVVPGMDPGVIPPVVPPPFPDVNRNGIDDRLERIAVFPDMPPYDPGRSDEWTYFRAPGMAQGGIVGYAEGGEVSPLAQQDPRIEIIAEAEDALEEILAGETEAADEQAIRVFVETFGTDALEKLKANVAAGMKMRAKGARRVKGPGGPKDDAVPAVVDGRQPVALSDGEFIFSTDAVAAAGNGDPEAGAAALQKLHDKLAGMKKAA